MAIENPVTSSEQTGQSRRIYWTIFDPSPDWVWCPECRAPPYSKGALGFPLNAMKEVRQLADGVVYAPHPVDGNRADALARLEGHRRQYHTERRSLAWGRPARIPHPWRYIIFKRRDARDWRRWNYGMHATKRDEPWPIPEGAIEVRRGSAVSHEQVQEVFMRVGILRKMKNRRRQARVRFPECPTCKNPHSPSVEHYTCPRCRRFTIDARKVPGYPERLCRAGCEAPRP